MSTKKPILVAVKNEIRGSLIATILSAQGYEFTLIKNLSRLPYEPEMERCGITIIDLASYTQDPFTFLSGIRKKYPRTFIIVLPDRDLTLPDNTGLESFADAVLPPPLNPDKLLDAIRAGQDRGSGTTDKAPLPVAGKRVEAPFPGTPVQVPRVIAISGGKGGVGKSVITANLAAALAGQGRKVIIADLDIGGPNLHTFFGIRRIKRGVLDFLLRDEVGLQEVLSPTGIENLEIMGNTEDYAGAGISDGQRLKLVNGFQASGADYILLDLGAGAHANVIDFFLLAEKGIIITSPEITSILNTYGFIKGVLYRELETRFEREGKRELRDIVRNSIKPGDDSEIRQAGEMERELIRVDREAEGIIRQIRQRFRPGLVLNMVQRPEERKIGGSIKSIVKRYLDIEVDYYGYISRDRAVEVSIAKTAPFVVNAPRSPAAECLRRIAGRL